MRELNDFYNEGFGWICKQCDRELKREAGERSRLLVEGEAESKTPTFSSPALAKWADPEHRTLTCPRCGISELVDIA